MRIPYNWDSWNLGRQRYIPRIPQSPEDAHTLCPSHHKKGHTDKALGDQMTTFLGLRLSGKGHLLST